jgi:hypothetical protein
MRTPPQRTSPATPTIASATDSDTNTAAVPISAAIAARIGNKLRSSRFSTASESTVMRPSSSLLRISAEAGRVCRTQHFELMRFRSRQRDVVGQQSREQVRPLDMPPARAESAVIIVLLP